MKSGRRLRFRVWFFNPWGHKFSLGSCLWLGRGSVMWHPPAKQVTEDEYTDGQCGRCRFFILPARIVCRIAPLVFLMLEPAAISMLQKRRVGSRRRCNALKLADAFPDAAIMLAGHAAHLTERYGSGVYAGYMPIHSELSPLALLENLVGLGCDLALPITPQVGQPLRFHRWEIDGLLDDGPYGTKQPPADNDKCIPDVNIGAVAGI